MFERRDDGVADQVVDVVGPGAAGKAEKGGRHRCWPPGEDADPVAAGVALEVDQEVDRVGADALGNVAVAAAAQVDEVFAGTLDPRNRS